jgi:hypothetical protein
VTAPPGTQNRLRPCRKPRRERAARLLDALSDGKPQTALDLAERLCGADASGHNVQQTLRVLERAGAIVRDGQVWSDGYKHRIWLWRKTPEEKVTSKALERIRQRREIAARKDAQRPGRP